MQIAFWKYKVLWIMLIDFILALLNFSETHLQIQDAPWIEVTISFFYGAPWT